MSLNNSKGIRVIERTNLPFKGHSREITQKASMGEQSFLHATHRPDHGYQNYQNISKGIKVIERTIVCLWADRRTQG